MIAIVAAPGVDAVRVARGPCVPREPIDALKEWRTRRATLKMLAPVGVKTGPVMENSTTDVDVGRCWSPVRCCVPSPLPAIASPIMTQGLVWQKMLPFSL